MSKIPIESMENELDTLKKMEHQYKVLLQEYKRTFNIYMDSLKGKDELDDYKGTNIKYNNEYYRINEYGYMRKYEDWEKRDKTCKGNVVEIEGEKSEQFQKLLDHDIIRKGYRRAIGEPCDVEGNNIELKEEIVKQIPVGTSLFHLKTVVLPENDLKVSEIPVNPQKPQWKDTFKTTVQKIPFSKDMLFVERTDEKSGWGQNLILEGRKSKKTNKEYTIDVGISEGKNSKLVVLPESGMTVDSIPLQKTNMTFKTTVFSNQLVVTRTDKKYGWTEPIQLKGYKKQKYSKMGYLTQEGELEMYPDDEVAVQQAMNNGCPKNIVQLSPSVFNTFTKSSTPLTFESNCSSVQINNIRNKLDELQKELQTLSKNIEVYIQKMGKTQPNFNSSIHNLNDKMKTITDLRNKIDSDLKDVGSSQAFMNDESLSLNSDTSKLLMLLGFSLLSGGLIFKLTR